MKNREKLVEFSGFDVEKNIDLFKIILRIISTRFKIFINFALSPSNFSKCENCKPSHMYLNAINC